MQSKMILSVVECASNENIFNFRDFFEYVYNSMKQASLFSNAVLHNNPSLMIPCYATVQMLAGLGENRQSLRATGGWTPTLSGNQPLSPSLAHVVTSWDPGQLP